MRADGDTGHPPNFAGRLAAEITVTFELERRARTLGGPGTSPSSLPCPSLGGEARDGLVKIGHPHVHPVGRDRACRGESDGCDSAPEFHDRAPLARPPWVNVVSSQTVDLAAYGGIAIVASRPSARYPSSGSRPSEGQTSGVPEGGPQSSGPGRRPRPVRRGCPISRGAIPPPPRIRAAVPRKTKLTI